MPESMTSPSLENFQTEFTRNLFSENFSYKEAEEFLDHLIPMFGNSEQREEAVARFAIYRNNVILSLSTAVGDTFPVVKRLIGDHCFDSAAIAFVRKYPPQQPSLLFYGEEFIDFIKNWPGCSELTYLSDVARLEWDYIRAFHAEDAELLDKNELAQVAPESLAEVRFQLHPSVRLLQSVWPIDTIWQENLKAEVSTIDLESHSGCNLLLYRQQLQVRLISLNIDCYHFLKACSEGKKIAEAWSYCLQQMQNKIENEVTELSAMLGYLLSLPIFTAINTIAVKANPEQFKEISE